MFKHKGKIIKYFNNHHNYYSFYNNGDGDEQRGCFGLLKYGSSYYFALSGANACLFPSSKYYESRQKVVEELNGILKKSYIYAPLKDNAITFYSNFTNASNKSKTEIRKDNEKYLIFLTNPKGYATLKECIVESGKDLYNYLKRNTLFNCVERMLIANAEPNYDDFVANKTTTKFIIKWAPCVKCENAVKGKVLYYYEDFADFKNDYIKGKMKLKKYTK